MLYISSTKGFTLIEIMLVVVMLGIVAAAVFYM
jgi:prepilin-type N-terminal cleavage/methylation domain-containing protein